MKITDALDGGAWDAFLLKQRFSPFLQSWTMSEVYKELGQEPVRLQAIDDAGSIKGICLGLVVPAKRGRHIAIQYGPIATSTEVASALLEEMGRKAKENDCSFVRCSPFIAESAPLQPTQSHLPSPLHLLAEHIWYLPLKNTDRWMEDAKNGSPLAKEQLMADLRKTTRNLIRRTEKEGVTVERSKDPMNDLKHFIRLHDETRRRHGFTPYTDRLFELQLKHFAPKGQATLYLARYQDEVLASSIHMHMGGETSYHHGASTHAHPKIPASYLLQWTAICDALERGDDIYSFWGIAPMISEETVQKKHPFAGVTLFKRGFGGKLLNLQHSFDIPLASSYKLTRMFEQVRKWKRGF